MKQPQTRSRPHRRAAIRLAIVVVTASVALVVGVAIATRVPTWMRIRALKSPNGKVRRAAVRELGGRGGYTAVGAIRALIAEDPDPDVRAAAAHAAMRLTDALAAEPIRRAVREQPDCATTAEMLATLAQLCGPSPEAVAFVDACGRSGKPYRVVGAAMARAEWFQKRGVEELLTLAQSGPEEVRAFARDRLRQYLIPAAEMVGVRFDGTDPWPSERLEAMQSWWRTTGSDRLLGDALWARRSSDDDLHQVERLQHTRQRVGSMLGLL